MDATLAGNSDVSASGVFSMPVGQSAAGPLLPGHSYQFTVTAELGDHLSFATIFVQSNDLFFGPAAEGLALDGSGVALSGDITDQIMLWDAGTEVNQWPGAGMDRPLRQVGPNAGADDADTSVRLVNDGFPYPATNAAIRVTVSVE